MIKAILKTAVNIVAIVAVGAIILPELDTYGRECDEM